MDLNKLSKEELIHLLDTVSEPSEIENKFKRTIAWQRKCDADSKAKGMNIRCCWNCELIAKKLGM